MNSGKWLTCGFMVAMLTPLWLTAHAQSPSWTQRIEVLPQIVPNPAKMIPQEPSDDQGVSWGTGFVIAPGYLLTAFHVVQQRSQIRVGPVVQTQGGRPQWVAAELIKSDMALDLALLKIPETLPALKLNSSIYTPVGLEAFVIGYPQPRIQGTTRKITSGIVNGYRSANQSQPETGLLQISAEVSQGNSGGPVIAPDGTVIGMVQKKVNSTRVAEKTQDLLINVSYALRSSKIVDFLRSTDAAFQTQVIDLNNVLRPYQIFEMHQQSVLAVIGRRASSIALPSEGDVSK